MSHINRIQRLGRLCANVPHINLKIKADHAGLFINMTTSNVTF